MVLYLLLAILALGLVLFGASVRVVTQFERGIVLRFGRLSGTPPGPGLTVITPVADRLHKVNMQIMTMPVPAQEGITRDNVTVRVDAVVYFRVFDPVRVVVDVQNYEFAIGQVAQASLRSIIGKSDLDDLLSNRERLNQGLELMIDSPAVVQASEKLAQAAEVMAAHPAALQLRLLQTVVEVAAEKNSTLVLPFPVELLRFLERATPTDAASLGPAPTMDDAEPDETLDGERAVPATTPGR